MSVTIEHRGGVLSKGMMIGAMVTGVVAMGEAASCQVSTALEFICSPDPMSSTVLRHIKDFNFVLQSGQSLQYQ